MKRILLTIQLGSPKSTKTGDVRRYLREFLGDPRVVDLPKLLWWPILNLLILPFRPRRSAKAYKRVWTKEGAPLVVLTERMIAALRKQLSGRNWTVESSYLLSAPRTEDVLTEISKKHLGEDYELHLLPLFPQYSESTNASVYDRVAHTFIKQTYIPRHHFYGPYHLLPSFIQQSVTQIDGVLKNNNLDALVISFHGIPKRRVLEKGDPYERHCVECFHALENGLRQLGHQLPIHLTYQSRFGSEEWLGPATDEFALNLVEKGQKRLAFYCPSFLVDCLETIDEIGNELGEEVEHAGGKLILIPCLNDKAEWIRDFADDIEKGIKEKVQLAPKERPMEKMPMTENKNVLKIVFLTLFLDLVGFSIIFPLFPALAKHYIEVDGQNYFLNLIFGLITWTVGNTEGGVTALTTQSIVLFGGVLGALYSFLQFLSAPLWGGLSDRFGRRPILIWSVFWMAISYLLWFWAGSFTLLIIARIIGGFMGGNISTATAVVADVTTSEKRARGMAVVGIAFALGFILGPAIGGLTSLIDVGALTGLQGTGTFAINPFSGPALISFILSIINFILLWKFFPETLPPEKRGAKSSERTANIFKLFKPLPYAGVNLTNFGHFLFLLAFSGMEFTLTFLAVERLNYTPIDNAKMFIFIGFIIVLIQGGVVRRKAASIGEKKLALAGILISLPGLVLIGLVQSTWLLYTGLFFLSVGSAMVIPCLTALASRYVPSKNQGQGIGAFRSLGALARVFGPLSASLVYWQWGSAMPYFIGAAFLMIPAIMIAYLPPVQAHADESTNQAH